ncbi:MAG TPA: heme-binding protein [Burkholderiaceae bacterium]|jgi:hypothetical protein|nr:heme-binding protein [Burkholderiaceae bacterium]
MHTFAQALFGLLFLAMPAIGHAIEEPSYEVVRKIDDVEVRQYAPYIVAEVQIEADADEAGNLAFPILAGYIFGKNKGKQEFAMTAPVTQAAAPVRLEMTAPVTQAAASGTPGSHVVQFVLPRGVTLQTAPEPLDARVRLREMPAQQVAVIRYSGFWSDANYKEHLEKLRATLKAADLTPSGEPVFSRYNPPFTPWFMRRNEIWLALPSVR